MNIFNTYLRYINETILILLEENNILLENKYLLEKVVVEAPKKKQFGDLSTNAALILSSTFKTKPIDVAKNREYKALFGEQASQTLSIYEHKHDHIHTSEGKIKKN